MRFIHQTRLASLSQKSPSFVRCTHSGHRAYSTLPPHPQKAPSPHAQWYTDILPAMVPIFLLGSAVSLGLQLTQSKLSHEKYMDEIKRRIHELETEVSALQSLKQEPT